MEVSLGVSRINLHKVEKTLDANKQCSPISNLEYACSVTKEGKKINCNITDNVATITDTTLSEGDTVDLWLWCTRSEEGGGICKPIFSQADEDQWQLYMDTQ